MQNAVDGDRPFFLMANSHDPHRPFYGNDRQEWYEELDPPAVPPSRTFDPDEVVIPGFLPDIPEVRLEIAEYYNSVRRCDDTVGRLLDRNPVTAVQRRRQRESDIRKIRRALTVDEAYRLLGVAGPRRL